MQNVASTHSASSQSPRDVVQVAKATGDHLRANILRALAADSFSVMELGAIFTTAQPAMSHHLKVLRDAGLVTQRKEGTSIFYQRAVATTPFLRSLFNELDETALNADATRVIDGIHTERQLHSVDFFNSHAADFASHQALICDPTVYLASVGELLKHQRHAKALEIGPGHGELLEILSAQFDTVIGIDNAHEMLNLAKQSAAPNVSLCVADFNALDKTHEHAYDVVVAAMVLHHMASPAQFFTNAKRYLKPTGALIVADLCEHQQAWVRDHCGDFWLGFQQQQLTDWLNAAGLTLDTHQVLAQKNGFVVQVLSAKPT